MCFNYKVSLFTFCLGTAFSLLLINYGNKKYRLENITTGIFLIFISLIQFMDFLFWIDIKNTMGINKVTTLIGPLLNVGQPLIFYLIKYIYYKPDIFQLKHLPIMILNFLYFLYILKMYYTFIKNGNLTTTIGKYNILEWPWIKYNNYYYYLLLFALNIFYLFKFKYAFVFFSITYLFLYLSRKYFYYNIGEMWCFFGSFIPLIMYIIQLFL